MNATVARRNVDPDRVRRRTDPAINRQIDDEIEKNIRYYGAQPRQVITQRIHELEEEWDIERTLQTNAASLSLVGLTIGLAGRRRWLVFPVVVAGFLLMHGIQGWCPPVPVFRRAGVRTRAEIDRERFALKYLRGDFDDVKEGSANDADRAAALITAVLR